MLPDKKDQKSLPRAFGNLNRRSRDRKINNFDPLGLPDTEHHEPVQLMRTTGRCEPPQPEGLCRILTPDGPDKKERASNLYLPGSGTCHPDNARHRGMPFPKPDLFVGVVCQIPAPFR